MNKINILLGVLSLVLILLSLPALAQDVVNKNQYRIGLGVDYKLNDSWKIGVAPEIRFDDNFNSDLFLIEGELKYKPIKLLSLGATYRFEFNYRPVKETQYLNRYGLNATVKKKFNRFEPSFRLQWSNYADDEITNDQFLRYKFDVEYNIRKSKFTPQIGLELFQTLGDNSRLIKIRYFGGIDYKVFKNNHIGFSYKLDYYKYEYKNRHIFSLQYTYKF